MTAHSPQQVSPDARAEWLRILAQPMSPTQLAAHAKHLSEVMGDDFIIAPGSTWARECHLGARFAQALKARSVWLGDQPDLTVVDYDGHERQYELTEVLEPNRRRNDEYREDQENLAAGRSAARSFCPDNVPSTLEALRHTSKIKASKIKNYGSKPVGLVIYLNTDLLAYDECITLLERDLHESTSVSGKCFAEVWVMWAGRLYLVWQDQQPNELTAMKA